MKTKTVIGFLLVTFLVFAISYPAEAQGNNGSKSLKEGLFRLNEIDFHVHAGKERPLPMNGWIDLFVSNGRKVLLLLDHLELYRVNDTENKAWVTKNKLTDWYPEKASAKELFRNDLLKAMERRDILLFRGWEIWEGELDEGLEKEPMKDAEVLGCRIGFRRGAAPRRIASLGCVGRLERRQQQGDLAHLGQEPFQRRTGRPSETASRVVR